VRLPQLEYVVAIAEEGSYTAAGTRLTIAQPSLSQQVAALEKELGCQLFERLPRGVRLTPAGRAFLPEARATVLAARRARRAAQAATQQEGGTLEIATLGSMAIGVLPDAVSAWHRLHPDIALNVVSYRHHDALEAAVASGVGDFAIGPPPRRWTGETTILGREEFVVLLSADDPASRRRLHGPAPARRGELRDPFLAPAPVVRDANGHLRLVDIQRRWALDDRLHHAPLDRPAAPTAAQGPQKQTNLTVVLAAQSGAPGRPRTPNSKQAHRHQGKGRRHGRRQDHPPFHAPARVREADTDTRSNTRGLPARGSSRSGSAREARAGDAADGRMARCHRSTLAALPRRV